MATQVPYSGTPSVAPESAPIPSRSTDAPLGAFGGFVAQATQHLGQVAEGAGNELFARAVAMQQVNEAASANKAVADYTTELAQAYTAYRSKEGSDAVTSLQDYQKQANDLREKYRSTLNSDYAQKAFDQESRSMLARTMFSAAAHGADEAKKYDRQASAARVASSTGLVAADPNNEGHVTDSIRVINQEVEHQYRNQAPEVRKQKADELISGTLVTQVISLAKTDPFAADAKAEAYIKANRISGDDVTKVRDAVLRQVQSVGATNIGVDVASKPENRDASSGEIEKQAMAAAEKARPGDKEFMRLAVNHAISQHNSLNRIDANDQYDTLQTVQGVMGPGPDGKLPSTIEEGAAMHKNPAALDAWQKLDTVTKAKMQGVFAGNALGGYAKTDASQAEYQRLTGLSLSDNPDDRKEFMGTDVMSLHMPWTQRQQLLKSQNAIFKKVAVDAPPIEANARRLAGEDPAIALVLKSPSQRPLFIGGLHAAWEEYVKQYQKIPSQADIKTMGTQLMREMHTTQWFGRTDPAFKVPIPDEEAKRIKAGIEASGAQATPALMQKWYTQKMFNQFYAKPATGAKP